MCSAPVAFYLSEKKCTYTFLLKALIDVRAKETTCKYLTLSWFN